MSTIRRLAWSCFFSLSSVALIKGAARAQILKRHRKTAKNKTLNRCNMLRQENKTDNTTIFSRLGRKAKDKLLMSLFYYVWPASCRNGFMGMRRSSFLLTYTARTEHLPTKECTCVRI